MANTTLFKIKVIRWSNSITYETNWHCIFWWNTVEVYYLCHKRSNPSLCPKHQCWRNWSWSVLWRPKRPPRTNIKKKEKRESPIHHRGLGCKSRKSRDTQNNSQVWLWSTNWSKTKANRVLSREHTGHIKHPFQQIPKSDWLCSLSQRWRSFIRSAETRPGVDCGSDHELLIAKFRLQLKKVGKITRS